MEANLIEAIRKNLGYPSLKKVDPNNQEVNSPGPEDRLSQAAIPAVLAACIKYTDGPYGIKLMENNQDWLPLLYGGHEGEAIRKVADYSGTSQQTTRTEMQKMTTGSVSSSRCWKVERRS